MRSRLHVLDGRWRKIGEPTIRPVGVALGQAGVSADHLTATGLVMAVPTAVAIGSGHLIIGLVLLALAALPDMLDGAVAKASGTASARGAFFDSVADRVTDSLILGAVAWHLAVSAGGLAPILPLAVLACSTLISYERARAESLGYSAKGGVMERAERLIALAIGLAIPNALVPVLWVMLAATLATAVQRFVMVWRQASVPKPEKPVMAERWRAWRESTAERPSLADWRGAAARRSRREGHRRPSPAWRRRAGK